jgi:hypothetical protein
LSEEFRQERSDAHSRKGSAGFTHLVSRSLFAEKQLPNHRVSNHRATFCRDHWNVVAPRAQQKAEFGHPRRDDFPDLIAKLL